MPPTSTPPALRDRIMTEVRAFVCEKIGFVPFEHQARWWATTDGFELTPVEADPGEYAASVRLPDETVVKRRLVPRVQGRANVVAER